MINCLPLFALLQANYYTPVQNKCGVHWRVGLNRYSQHAADDSGEMYIESMRTERKLAASGWEHDRKHVFVSDSCLPSAIYRPLQRPPAPCWWRYRCLYTRNTYRSPASDTAAAADASIIHISTFIRQYGRHIIKDTGQTYKCNQAHAHTHTHTNTHTGRHTL